MTETGIVVVGGGVAGHAVVRAVRARSARVPLTLVCGEPRLPYERDTAAELAPAAWYAAHGVHLRLGLRAAALRPAARRVRLDDGEVLPFSAAVICTGAETLRLAGAYALRDPEDAAAIARAAADARHAVVIGGGRRGLDAARQIAAHGCAVNVVDFAASVVAISRGEDGVDGVVLAGGDRLAAELVVCVATRAQTALAQSAGLAVDGAIVVDERLRTSAAGVLAVGACVGHAAPIPAQAEIAADELLGLTPVHPALRVAEPPVAASA